jgi:hypothetical protein
MAATQTLDPETADARVELGMEFLNESDAPKINKKILDIENFETCIGGQLAKHDMDLFNMLGCDAAKGVECGFDLAYKEATPENYETLTAAWKKAL